MVHQPSAGFQGQATDIEIHAKEVLDLKNILKINDKFINHEDFTKKVAELTQ